MEISPLVSNDADLPPEGTQRYSNVVGDLPRYALMRRDLQYQLEASAQKRKDDQSLEQKIQRIKQEFQMRYDAFVSSRLQQEYKRLTKKSVLILKAYSK